MSNNRNAHIKTYTIQNKTGDAVAVAPRVAQMTSEELETVEDYAWSVTGNVTWVAQHSLRVELIHVE